MEPRHTTGFAGGLEMPPVAGPLLPIDSLGGDSLTAAVAEYRVEETARPVNAKRTTRNLVDSGERTESRLLRVPEARQRDQDGHDRERFQRLATAMASELDADFLALLSPRAAASIALHGAQSAGGAAFLLRASAAASGPMSGDARGQAAFFAGYHGNEDLSWAFASNRGGSVSERGRGHRPHRPHRPDGGQTVAALEDPPGNPPSGPPPVPPAAQPDSYYAVYNTQLSVPAAGVLANDAGSPLTAVLDSQPTFGAVNLNSNGSFIYVPPSNQEGVATFTYHAHNGQQSSNVTTVTITVWRPKVDVDVDSNNNGTIDPLDGPSGTDDPIEENAPGVYVPVNDDDDNGNEVYDWAEAPSVGGNGQPLWDDELVRANLELELQAGLNLSGFTVQLNVGSGFKIWDTAFKQTDLTNAAFTLSSGSGGLPQYVYLEALQSGLATLTATLLNPQGGQVHQDTAKAKGMKVDLDVDSNFDGIHDANDTPQGTDDPIEYTPFRPGEYLVANVHDKDHDGVIDFADGYNADGNLSTVEDNVNAQERFTELLLDVATPITSATRIQFYYAESDPANITFEDGIYTPAGQTHWPGNPSGLFRIWTQDGGVARDRHRVDDEVTPGDFVPSFVPLTPAQLGIAEGSSQITLYLEAVAPTLILGSDSIGVSVHLNDGTGKVVWDGVRVTALNLNAGVDADRDRFITQLDEPHEDDWDKGPGTYGAIVLPNSDKDNTNTNAPDNWAHLDWNRNGVIETHERDWDGDGVDDPPNNILDTISDIADMAPLAIARMGFESLPDDLLIRLEVSEPPNPTPSQGYYSNIPAQERVRVFSPYDVVAVIGPEAGPVAEFVKTPTGPMQHSYYVFQGDGIADFRVEGLEFGAEVDITVTALAGGRTIYADQVRIRVAPFVLSDHTMAGQKAYVTENMAISNSQLITALENVFGAANVVKDSGADPWQQDGYEIGYAKAPYGAMPVVLELPRGFRDDGLQSPIDMDLHKFLRAKFPQSGVATVIRIPPPYADQDDGGNIESIPLPSEPGKFFYGDQMNSAHTAFFVAADVNAKLDVNTDWLDVGHVDEVVSAASNGEHVIVADPEVAWALLLLAESIDANAVMHANMNGNGLGGVSVANALSRVGLAGAALHDFNFTTVMAAANLSAVRSAVEGVMGTSGPESTPLAGVGNTGGAAFIKSGALVGFFPNARKRSYEITFISANTYELRYKEEGDANWAPTVETGNVGNDEVFWDARAFIFEHWWNTTAGGANVGDVFTFEADPNAKTIEMPVLFLDLDKPNEARAYTVNHVNSVVNTASVITGKAFGPEVDYDGSGIKPILDRYVAAMFAKAGYSNVVPVDSRYYHANCGDVHCGTNVLRALPTYDWWDA